MKTQWGLILALWGAGLGAGAQFGKISVVFHLLPDIYPQAGAALGFVVSLVGFVGILLGVVAGLLVARITCRRALLWAMWLGAALSLFQALLPVLPLMLGARVLEGVSHIAIVVAAPTLIARLSAPSQQGAALTLWGTIFAVAFALLGWFGPPLVDSAGLSALFLAHAAYMAVFALLLAWALPPDSSTTEGVGLSWRQLLKGHSAVYRSAPQIAPAAGFLFYTASFVAVLTVLPPFVDQSQRLLIMGAIPLMSIAASMTLGVVLLRVAPALTVCRVGFALCLAAAAWIWVVPGGTLACLALGGAMGLVQGASFAAVPQLNPGERERALSNGALAQMGNLGNTLGTPILAAGVFQMGYPALPLFVVVAAGAGLAVLLGFARRLRG
ncbi:MAG: MFS transporter [Pseudomonadota bacterium]